MKTGLGKAISRNNLILNIERTALSMENMKKRAAFINSDDAGAGEGVSRVDDDV